MSRTQLPPRLLPVLYFGAAHTALAVAFGAVALDPRGVAGFFHHARMLAIVHLVTLGCITASILRSLSIEREQRDRAAGALEQRAAHDRAILMRDEIVCGQRRSRRHVGCRHDSIIHQRPYDGGHRRRRPFEAC
jgi:hypothetical protein